MIALGGFNASATGDDDDALGGFNASATGDCTLMSFQELGTQGMESLGSSMPESVRELNVHDQTTF
jgi:hypothetical protein